MSPTLRLLCHFWRSPPHCAESNNLFPENSGERREGKRRLRCPFAGFVPCFPMQSLVQTVFSALKVCEACPILQVVREIPPGLNGLLANILWQHKLIASATTHLRLSRTVFISKLAMLHACAAWSHTFCASGNRNFR